MPGRPRSPHGADPVGARQGEAGSYIAARISQDDVRRKGGQFNRVPAQAHALAGPQDECHY
jgi:hypothetical protein